MLPRWIGACNQQAKRANDIYMSLKNQNQNFKGQKQYYLSKDMYPITLRDTGWASSGSLAVPAGLTLGA